MRLALAALALASLAGTLSGPLFAAPQSPYYVYLDFEDLTGAGAIPADYGTVDDWGSWSHSDVLDPNYPPASGAVTITSSLPQAPIQFGEDVVFEVAAIVTSEPFAWKLYYQGQLVHTTATVQPNLGGAATYLPSGYGGFVDAIEFETSGNAFAVDDLQFVAGFDGGFGQPYCTALPNASGLPGRISFLGSPIAADNDFTLVASDLPVNEFGIFVTSRERGFIPMTGISNGPLCLGGEVRRFFMASQILLSDAGGQFSLQIDLTAIPEGLGTVRVMAGETWRFQSWFRDPVMDGSNFTDAREITFS